MDVLSDTLRAVRLSGAIFLNMRLAPPWAAESEPPNVLAQYLRLPSDCVALFHICVRGQAWFYVPHHAPVMLSPGDAILIPHSTPHVMRSDRRAVQAPTPMRFLLPSKAPDGIVLIDLLEKTDSRDYTQFICGYLHCDQRFNPLIGALPELIVAKHCDDDRETEMSNISDCTATSNFLLVPPGDWLETTLQYMTQEALGERPGSSDMLARLSEILFVEMVRRYMRRLPPYNHGWLAGVRDPIVGQTLRLLHAQPQRAWTVAELADAVAVSRSSLAQRFTALIGETPMRYLAGWRIQLAKHLLKETNLHLGEIAERVGYESEVAFNRAFKRHVGWPPATWRTAGEIQRPSAPASTTHAHTTLAHR